MGALLHDLRSSLRAIARRPGYAGAVVALLALGIGANAAIFSVVHTILVRPLPFPDDERIVRVWETYSYGKGRGSVSMPNYRDWIAAADGFEALGAYWIGSRNLQDAGEPERLRVLEATAPLWGVLGVRPLAGRLFTEAEEREEARVAVLSEGLWRRRFGGDPAAVGRVIVLDGESHLVIGVLPAGFRFPLQGEARELFLPHRMTGGRGGRGNHYLQVLGKLRPGVDLDAGRSQLEAIAARLAAEHPGDQTGRSVAVETFAQSVRGPVRPLLLVLFAAVAAVLAVACANLAGLAMARAEAHRRDASIRAALGASRTQLVRRHLGESLLLAAAGAAAGALLAQAILALVRPLAARVLPDLGALELDAPAFGFLLEATVATAIGFGLVPALAAARSGLARQLVESGTRTTAGRARHRVRRLLVATQIALSLTLLVGAGLLVRTFQRLLTTSPGFERVGVVTVHLTPTGAGRDRGTLAPTLLTPVLERLRGVDGVEAAGVANMLPVQSWGNNSSYSIEGLEPPAPGQEWWVENRTVSPGWFEALGVPLRAGRMLTEADGDVRDPESDAPLPAVVNEAFARRHFPGADPARAAVGRRIAMWGGLDIVGVVGDTRQGGLDTEPLPEVSLAYNDARIESMLARDVTLIVRSSLSAAAATAAVGAALREVDSQQPLHTVRTLDEVIEESLGGRRLTLGLIGSFAAVAALLAGIGLYALVSQLVVQRRREIGVRMALGATARAIGRWVVAEGLSLTGLGVVLGLAGGWGASKLVAHQLYDVGPLDPWTWSAVLAFVAAVALAATLGPALRAARTEPSQVLHEE